MSEIIKTVLSDRAEWSRNYQLHRLDGPAVEQNDGDKYWYQHGQLHRTDGPAVSHANGYKAWYQKGNRHRVDGPAIEYVDGSKSWWYQGKRINCQTQQEFEKFIRLKCFW
jgi:hypothetical protein